MKRMIRSFLLPFTGLILISVLSPAIPESKESGSYSMNVSGTLTSEGFSDFKFYSGSNEQVILNLDSNYFIVLKNNHNCINCFRQLNDFIKQNSASLNAKAVVVAQIDSTTLDRKRNFYENKKLMPDFNDYLFQYKNSNHSIFEYFNTTYTPEVVVITGGKITHISYSDIFDHFSLDLSTPFQLQISELLK